MQNKSSEWAIVAIIAVVAIVAMFLIVNTSSPNITGAAISRDPTIVGVHDRTLSDRERATQIGLGQCVGDLDNNGHVESSDLQILLNAWGPCSGPCPADLNNDGVVDASDLLIILGNWGPCSGGSDPNPLENGLVSHYTFTGNSQDASGNNHAIPFGTVQYGPGAQGGQALLLQGNGYVEAPHSADLSITEKLSLSVWINPTTFDEHWQAIIGKGDNTYQLRREGATNRLRFTLRDGASSDVVTNANIQFNQWTHIAATYDGSMMRIYVNGELDSQAPRTGLIGTNNLGLQIGVNTDGNTYRRHFKGSIDQVRIYDRALTPSEIQILAGQEPQDPICGDGVVNQAWEECDGNDFAGATCASQGFFSGQLSCTQQCTISTASCFEQGDYGDSLIPGNGWTGPQAPMGSFGAVGAPGYNAQVIARWDVVPYQTFTGIFEIGVVAFHMNGVDRVEFSVENGPWVPVYEMTLNPRTGVYEYWTTLDASAFQEYGPVEIRAIAYPKNAGKPRVLAGPKILNEGTDNPTITPTGEYSLILNPDPNGQVLANRQVRWVSPTGTNDPNAPGAGTQNNPFRTIKEAAMHIQNTQGSNVDNGLIYLTAGDHEYGWVWSGANHTRPTSKDAWLTITAAPGVAREDVRIDRTAGRLNAQRVHLKDITVSTTLVSTQGEHLSNKGAALWHDNTFLTRYSRALEITATQFQGGIYYTDTSVNLVRNAYKSGWTVFVRNAHVTTIGEDAFFNIPLVINGYVDGIDTSGLTGGGADGVPHPDVVQYHGVKQNHIVYGLEARNANAQGMFMRSTSHTPSKDIAWINIVMENTGYYNQILNPVDHMLIWHNTFVNEPLRIGDDPTPGGSYQTVLKDTSIRNNVFNQYNFGLTAHLQSPVFDHNHFITGTLAGTNPTSGNPGFVNPANSNYAPGPGSQLLGRVNNNVIVPGDVYNNPVQGNGAIGAVQP